MTPPLRAPHTPRNMSAFRPSPAPSPPPFLRPRITPLRPARHWSSPTAATASSPQPPSSSSSSSPSPSPRPNRHLHAHPNPRLHNAAITRHAERGNLRALTSAVRAARADNFVLNAVNYTTIINAHATHGRAEDALRLLADMRAEGVTPTNVTLRIALKVATRMRYPPDALRAVSQTFAWVRAAAVDAPDGRTWNLVMAALIRLNGVSQALSVLRSMRRADRDAPQPTACSFNHCISALGRARQLREALALFADMARRPPPAAPDVVSFNAILDAALCYGTPKLPIGTPPLSCLDFAAAVEAAMRRRGVVPNVKTDTLLLRLSIRGLADREDEEEDVLDDQHQDDDVRSRKNECEYECGETRPFRQPPRRPRRQRRDEVLQDTWSRVRAAFQADALFRESRGALDKQFFDAAIGAFAACGSATGMSDALDAMVTRRICTDELTVRAVLCGATRRRGSGSASSITSNTSSYSSNISNTSNSNTSRSVCDNALAIAAVHALHDGHVVVSDAAYATALGALRDAPADALAMLKAAAARRDGAACSAAMASAAIGACGADADAAVRVWQLARDDGVCAEQPVLATLGRACGRAGRPDLALQLVYAVRRVGAATMRAAQGRAFATGFERGLRDRSAKAGSAVEKNVVKKQYARLLRVECGARDADAAQWPLYRIRIRL